MLISAHIHEFRSCKDVEIKDFRDITAFIGRNGAGKTNILKAIKFATKCLVDSQLSIYELSFLISIVFEVDGKTYRYTVYNESFLPITEEMICIDKGVDDVVLFSRNGNSLRIFDVGNEVGIENHSLSSFVIRSLFPKNPVSDVLKSIFEFMKSISYIDFLDDSKLPSLIILIGDFKKWTRSNTHEYSSGDTLFKILQMYFHDKDLFEELLSLLGNNGLNLVQYIDINTLGDEFYLIRFHSPEGCKITFNNLSFGTRRIVHLLTSMLYDKASVALIEQPEDGIHPGLLQKIIQLLRDYANPNQFILTSHSPYVLNRLKPEEIRMVDMKEGKTRIRVLNEKEIEIANDFIENEGALSEFIDSIEEL